MNKYMSERTKEVALHKNNRTKEQNNIFFSLN
jgi:hypothetical protein